MTRCLFDTQKLALYYDGELTGDVARAVERHVKTCAGCRRELLRLAEYDALFAQLPQPPPSPGFTDRVTGRVVRIERLRRAVIGRVAPAAAALLICLLGARLHFADAPVSKPSPAVVRNYQMVENLDIFRFYDLLHEFTPPESEPPADDAGKRPASPDD